MRSLRITVVVLLLVASLSFGFTPKPSSVTRPCTISIDSLTFSGLHERQRFTTRFRSPKECRQLADLHRPNFEEERVKRKQVRYEWNVLGDRKPRPKFIRGYTRTLPKKMKPILVTFRRR